MQALLFQDWTEVFGHLIKMDLSRHYYLQRSLLKWEATPGKIYTNLTREFGEPFYDLIEASANSEQKEKLKNLSASQIKHNELAGEKIKSILTNAPGNDAPIGGLKVITDNGWFAGRPSGTQDIYKIDAESFLGNEYLKNILKDAQSIVDTALKQ